VKGSVRRGTSALAAEVFHLADINRRSHPLGGGMLRTPPSGGGAIEAVEQVSLHNSGVLILQGF
jgi:hypothetical protein